MPGHDVFAAALAAGATYGGAAGQPAYGRRLHRRYAWRRSSPTPSSRPSATRRPRASGCLPERDPDAVETALWALEPAEPIAVEAVRAGRRQARHRPHRAQPAARRLRRSAPEVVPLSADAPYGRIAIDTGGCTLCLSCVSACPVGALGDNPDRPGGALHRGRLRAMRPLRQDLPGEGDHARPAAQLLRRRHAAGDAQLRGAVRLHPLRQAVRREIVGGAHRRAARRAFDVPGERPRRPHQDVRRLPHQGAGGDARQSVRGSGTARAPAPRRTTSTRARRACRWRISSARIEERPKRRRPTSPRQLPTPSW